MGQTIYVKGGADPVLITTVVLSSIQYRFGLLSRRR